MENMSNMDNEFLKEVETIAEKDNIDFLLDVELLDEEFLKILKKLKEEDSEESTEDSEVA